MIHVIIFFHSGISYDDYRLAMKGKKDLHFVPIVINLKYKNKM